MIRAQISLGRTAIKVTTMSKSLDLTMKTKDQIIVQIKTKVKIVTQVQVQVKAEVDLDLEKIILTKIPKKVVERTPMKIAMRRRRI
jgi:hypothetical protein